MITEISTKHEFWSCVGEGEKDGDSITQPLKDVVTNIPTKNEKSKHKLKTQTPQNRTPLHLKIITSNATPWKLKKTIVVTLLAAAYVSWAVRENIEKYDVDNNSRERYEVVVLLCFDRVDDDEDDDSKIQTAKKSPEAWKNLINS